MRSDQGTCMCECTYVCVYSIIIKILLYYFRAFCGKVTCMHEMRRNIMKQEAYRGKISIHRCHLLFASSQYTYMCVCVCRKWKSYFTCLFIIIYYNSMFVYNVYQIYIELNNNIIRTWLIYFLWIIFLQESFVYMHCYGVCVCVCVSLWCERQHKNSK